MVNDTTSVSICLWRPQVFHCFDLLEGFKELSTQPPQKNHPALKAFFHSRPFGLPWGEKHRSNSVLVYACWLCHGLQEHSTDMNHHICCTSVPFFSYFGLFSADISAYKQFNLLVQEHAAVGCMFTTSHYWPVLQCVVQGPLVYTL